MFEKRVWRLGYCDWRWEVREHGALNAFEFGRADSRQDAHQRILAAISRWEAKQNARWVPIEV